MPKTSFQLSFCEAKSYILPSPFCRLWKDRTKSPPVLINKTWQMTKSVKVKTMWKTASKDEKPIWRENIWVASGSFSQFRISHRLLQWGKGYEEVKCGDQVKISLKLFKRLLLAYGNITFKYLKIPSKIISNSILLKNMICKKNQSHTMKDGGLLWPGERYERKGWRWAGERSGNIVWNITNTLTH